MKRFSKGGLIGAALGLLIWMYDYDFFFNAGGPETAISNAMLRFAGLTDLPYPYPVMLPCLILAATGFAMGAGIQCLSMRRHR